jgi:hypothetical protein
VLSKTDMALIITLFWPESPAGRSANACGLAACLLPASLLSGGGAARPMNPAGGRAGEDGAGAGPLSVRAEDGGAMAGGLPDIAVSAADDGGGGAGTRAARCDGAATDAADGDESAGASATADGTRACADCVDDGGAGGGKRSGTDDGAGAVSTRAVIVGSGASVTPRVIVQPTTPIAAAAAGTSQRTVQRCQNGATAGTCVTGALSAKTASIA